jgi:CHAD domain-containing protein
MTKLLADHSIMAGVPAEAAAPEPVDNARRSPNRAVSLSFVLAAEDADGFAARLNRLSGVGAANLASRTVYLDTPDHAITGLGLGFGIRRRNTTKRSGWKRFVTPLSAATPKSARRRLNHSLRCAAAISVVACVETQRRQWLLRFDDCQAELRLDCSTAQMNGREVAVASASFTSNAPNADFFQFVAAACDPEKLRLSAESDLLRIFRLNHDGFGLKQSKVIGPLPPHLTAFAPDLDAAMDAAAGFRTIAMACFDQFLLNEAAIRATGDREAVHQCRVALRRLSACLRFFSDFVVGSDYEALWQGFKELGAHLRKARDLDVLIADVVAPALAFRPPAGATALMRELEARREQAHADLVGALCAPASAALFLKFVIWLQVGDWMHSVDPKSRQRQIMPIVKYMRREFATLNHKFVLRCCELSTATQEERHRTRIRAKNLRYDAEFLETLARGKTAMKRLRVFIQTLKTLQTVLGNWNDIVMAHRFFIAFGAEAKGKAKMVTKTKRRSSLAFAAEALSQRIGSMSETEFREKSSKACQALVKGKPFWTKLA